MMLGAGWELRHMSISELIHRPERARRLEVFTGAGRRRTFPADEKAALVAESYAPGMTVCGVSRRQGRTWVAPRGVEGSVKNPSTPGGRNGTQTTSETVYA